MTLLEEIQTAAIDASIDLATLLRKCKLLAARLGSQPLENWVQWESDGYPDEIPVPEYRIWSLELKGHFSGPGGSGMRNAPIPTACIPSEVRRQYTHYECRASIASVEATLENRKDGTLTIGTGDLQLALGANVYRSQNCVQVWAEFSVVHFVELANAVRNRILELAIAVWKESPRAGELSVSEAPAMEANRVTQIFNTVVYGGTANLVGTANSSNIEFNITANDFEALSKMLAENGVAPTDISELDEALKSEPTPLQDGSFGPKVSSWVANMVKKAANGTWNVGLGAAGSLLATVLAKYYGLG